jgi:hypothetical protein
LLRVNKLGHHRKAYNVNFTLALVVGTGTQGSGEEEDDQEG